ncbi:hypothetical protein C8R47DRAFT_1321734, partial [Mycena vitilis]
MSLTVEGFRPASLAFSSSPVTQLSATFRATLRLDRDRFLFTTFPSLASGFSALPLSFTLDCKTSAASSTDVVLGLDWSAHVRDSLLALGHRVESTFDARFLLVPAARDSVPLPGSAPSHPTLCPRASPPSWNPAFGTPQSPSLDTSFTPLPSGTLTRCLLAPKNSSARDAPTPRAANSPPYSEIYSEFNSEPHSEPHSDNSLTLNSTSCSEINTSRFSF